MKKVIKNPNTVLLNVISQQFGQTTFASWGAHQTWMKRKREFC
jgi:hypothetical protein